MISIRIETDGLTMKEALELESYLKTLDEIAEARFMPFLPGEPQTRSFPIQAAVPHALHLLIKLADGAALATGAAATNHLYKKVGEGIVDKAWEKAKSKFTSKSVVEAGVKLYGPDGELIKEHRGRR